MSHDLVQTCLLALGVGVLLGMASTLRAILDVLRKGAK